jgi:protein phosphatase PTC7
MMSLPLLWRQFCLFSVALWVVYASAPVAEDIILQENIYNNSSTADEEPTISSRFVHKTVIIPHDQKKHRGGEDAAATTDRLLVVADGVGGWAKRGVNPGLYSRLLTKTVVDLFHEVEQQQTFKDRDDDVLVNIVHEANQLAAAEHIGSATCTVVRLVSPDSLQTLNIGDSGYSIHRRNVPKQDKTETTSLLPLEVVFASVPGQRQFNFPYQIGGEHGDVVSKVAKRNTHTLRPGDIIVVYSDGVSDNLYPEEYHDCIDRYSHKISSSEFGLVSFSLVADCIARQAYSLGKDKTFDSPFARGARDVGKRYVGGKHDDITVTVARVVQSFDKGTTAPSSAPTTSVEDPHYTESIYVYTGPVPSRDDLPTLEDVLAGVVKAGGPENDEL